LRDVLHCPSAPFNLISVSWLTNAGYTVSRLYRLRLADFTNRALVART